MTPGLARRAAGLAFAAAFALLAACSSAVRFDDAPAGWYTVRKGDTLYSIALRNDVDWRDVARWNGIRPPYTIEVGQRLVVDARVAAEREAGQVAGGRTPATGTAPAGKSTNKKRGGTVAPRPVAKPAPPPATAYSWSWPADGALVARFRAGVATAKGVDIAGKQGSEVRAAFDGKVVYVGSGLVGYGRVIIVKHDDRYLSAYAHNDRFLVAEGDAVKRGQPIATMGLGPNQRALLHFEIRLDGRAIDPMSLLPPR